MSFRSVRALPVLLLAATLLVAQWLLVQHEAQLAAHAAHTDCEWCLTHAPLTGALPAAESPFVAADAPSLVAESFASGFRSVFHSLYASRAPPFSPVV